MTTYRLILEAYESDEPTPGEQPTARFGTEGMKFEADNLVIGAMIFNSIYENEGLEPYDARFPGLRRLDFPLDPQPYRDRLSPQGTRYEFIPNPRRMWTDVVFAPRPGYSQNEEDYQ